MWVCCLLSPFSTPLCLLLAVSLRSLGRAHLSSCLSMASFFFAAAQGTAGKWRRSASSMYRKMLAWGAPIKTAAGYGAAATAGGATAPTVAGSVMGFFGFSSVVIVKGSTASHMMAAAGGMLKAGSWCSFWQSASTGGMYASYVFRPCTLGMSVVVFAYSKRREMYQRMTSIYKKFKG